MAVPDPYFADPIEINGTLADIKIRIQGKTRHMWGRDGAKRETDLAAKLPPGSLPVLIGSGLGTALKTILDQGHPAIVVDRESTILELTGLHAAYRDDPRVLWLDGDVRSVLERAGEWRRRHGGKPLCPLTMPLYTGLDRDHYGAVALALKQDSPRAPKSPNFASRPPRILMLTSQYFLLGEIQAACERMEIPHLLVNLGQKSMDADEFLSTVTQAATRFRPDFVFTVNHLGVDREGVLLSLLEQLNLPLASWFVDNPHLILYLYPKVHSPRTALFTWDADNIPSLAAKGYENLFHLPLAADETRFKPGLAPSGNSAWRADISFVGNSMVAKTAHRLKAARPGTILLKESSSLAQGFGEQPEPSVAEYIRRFRPELEEHYAALASRERTLAFETFITWESTRRYRTACLEQILPYSPLIVGDKGWKTEFKDAKGWRYHSELSYYDDLPRFYPLSTVNFNCTSLQMKGAVNQRVFDVPAAGAFLLTDERRQMEDLFEPGIEVATYASLEDIPVQLDRWLNDKPARTALVRAARKRVLADHTYEKRVESLIRTMRRTFC